MSGLLPITASTSQSPPSSPPTSPPTVTTTTSPLNTSTANAQTSPPSNYWLLQSTSLQNSTTTSPPFSTTSPPTATTATQPKPSTNTNTSTSTYITITTPERNATILVKSPVFPEQLFMLAPSQELTFSVPLGLVHEFSGKSRKGISVSSSVFVHVFLYTKITFVESVDVVRVQSLGVTCLYPQVMLSTSYVVVTPSTVVNSPDVIRTVRLMIVSSGDNNTVTVRFSLYNTSAPISFTMNQVRVVAPEVLDMVLNTTDVYFIESEGDLTGSTVTASLPVAVFVGAREVWRDNLTYYLPLAGDALHFRARNNTDVTADGPVSGIQYLRRNETGAVGRVDCMAPVVSMNLWRSSYAWAVPRNMTELSTNVNESVALYVVVIMADDRRSSLLLNGGVFQPDNISYVEPVKDFVVMTKRISSGFHQILSNGSFVFGAFIYGEHIRTSFCTGIGVQNFKYNLIDLGRFPISGNDLITTPYVFLTTTTTTVYTTSAMPSSTIANVTSPGASASPSQTSTTTGYTTSSNTPTVTSSNTRASANSTSATSSVTSPPPALPCLPTGTLTNLTKEELSEVLNDIREALYVDTKSLSSTVRKLISMDDERPSSQGIGALGISIIATVLVLMVAGDVMHAGYWLWELIFRRPQTM
ncbi:mucin-5AC-like [Physella acuta]|uniref:mucin-5AC-like n=1 Tax=Physella acuta TaxID=109671 RepID=UPI0027DC6A37|nr:mucin-5AC-like [Physella acuta]